MTMNPFILIGNIELITIISFSDIRGGAAKAAQRIVAGLRKEGVHLEYVVAEKKSNSELVLGPGFISKYVHFLLRVISVGVLALMKTSNKTKHSLNLFSSGFVLKKARVTKNIHLHWINNDTLSITALSKLVSQKKVIITLHDEWFYCGAEHCAPLQGIERYKDGYLRQNSDVSGVDLNRIVWNLKRARFKNFEKVVFTVPSKWLYERAKESLLLSNSEIVLIPNAIPTEVFKFKQTSHFNYLRSDNPNEFVILFGAVNINNNPLKGGALLYDALKILSTRLSDIDKSKVTIIIFGGDVFEQDIHGFRALGIGKITSEDDMCELYNIGNLTVVPSLVESFGQVAAESLACATPVLAFDTSGIKDIVDHCLNGFLAKINDANSLAEGMQWFLNRDKEQLHEMGLKGMKKVQTKFSTQVVSEQYSNLYNQYFDLKNPANKFDAADLIP